MHILGFAGSTLIKRFEQLRLSAYQDQGGVWTLGYGHTDPVITKGSTCTETQADYWFVDDTETAVIAVNRDLRVEVSQNQFDALVSFFFNVGITAAGHSTLIGLVNRDQITLASLEFAKWDHCRGVVDKGLTVRRDAERALFMTP